MNWTTAEKFCQNMSSHLASVTRNTSDYLTKASRRHWPVWIGGTDQEKEGLWKWTDSSPWNFTNWDEGYPRDKNGKKNCLSEWPWGWEDLSCHRMAWFLCSKQKETGENSKLANLELYQTNLGRRDTLEIAKDKE